MLILLFISQMNLVKHCEKENHFLMLISPQVAENERPRLTTEAITKKREAETQANITIAKAESEARIIINKYACSVLYYY